MAKRRSYKHLIGKRKNLLTVLSFRHIQQTPTRVRVFVTVVCDCGKRIEIPPDRFGKAHSCGCITNKIISASKITHGTTRRGQRWLPEYGIWAGMIRRCENPKVRGFLYYGGRGIRVCTRWRYSFEMFYKDMGPRPSTKHSIDRIDNDGHYEPINCRWVIGKIQARGRARYLEIDGLRRPASEWASDNGLATGTLLARIRSGRDVAEAVATPVSKNKRK